MKEEVSPTDYRARIYEYYVHSRHSPLAPDSVAGFKPREAHLKRLIKHHFPQNEAAVILELGCGHGTLIYFAREMGYHNILGVDRSPEQVAAAKHLGIEGVQQGDLMQTLEQLPNDSQDVVVAFDVLEHFSKEEVLPFVDQVSRVLRPGGKWILHTVNAESPFFGRIRYGDITHEQAFTRVSIHQLLIASGFQQVRCFDDPPTIHGIKSTIRWVLWQIIRAMLRFYLMIETGSGKDAIFSQNFLVVAEK